MKPPPFEYFAAESLEAALSALAEHGDDAKALAGGQSLVPAMNFRVAQPSFLVDLNRISSLDYVEPNGNGGVRIGAMARQSRLERDPLIAERAPLLSETIPYIAHPQIRNRGTIGGSMAHADPAAELPVIAMALGARFRARKMGGERWISADTFFQGMFTTDLDSDELLIEMEFPAMPARTGWSFVEFSRRKGDYALAGVAAVVSLGSNDLCEQARLVYLNVGDGPVDAQASADLLRGQALTENAFEEAAQLAAAQEIDPFGSVHATIEYQRHLARVLTRRALRQAASRAIAAHTESVEDS